MKLMHPWLLLPLMVLSAGPVLASAVEVKLKLPQRARLNLQGRKSIAVTPFAVVSKEGENKVQGRNIDVQKEFGRYLFKVLRRETELKTIDSGPVDFPTYDLKQLSKQTDFWRSIGDRTQADLILSGAIDFDIQDRTGYRTEEYTSPFNGQPYYRQVLVEQTGFQYDILLQVYDGKTGELLYEDNFKDFQNFQGQNADPMAGMFENLLSLEDRILNVFTQKEVEASRILFTQ
ncbi:MAG TPA: flagella assembly protein FlgT middle domain-containing protein [Thermoanaerobaculia bacterium]|nr:flagella assembly protein FlgT middle domain-containing protein [Thermoanaerobaculia bacterium]